MAHIQRQAAQAQQEWIAAIAQHCTHQLTLHTNLSTYNKSAATVERMTTEAHTALDYFIPRFNRAVTGNGWRRKNTYKPIIVPSLEGTLNTYDRHRTLHWHILIGNLPAHCTTEQLLRAALSVWQQHATASTNINCTELWHTTGFSNYIQKETRQGNYDCVATQLIQAPQHII
jgi:hypothetical protein